MTENNSVVAIFKSHIEAETAVKSACANSKAAAAGV
jgi:hypothetical protein